MRHDGVGIFAGKIMRLLIVMAMLAAGAYAPAAVCDDIYQAPEAFIAEAFGGSVPTPAFLWLTGSTAAGAEQILAHEPPNLRVRYWRRDARTAWILEEIGKERPITSGWVVEKDAIRLARVLAFRESRGWEIRQRFFTDQFNDARLSTRQQLDRNIDGITGATLSVNAMRRMARLALFYHQQVMANVP